MHTLKTSSKSRNQQRAGFAAGSGNQTKAPKTASEKKEKGKGEKKKSPASESSVQIAGLFASRNTSSRAAV
jgi:hypothetical protein